MTRDDQARRQAIHRAAKELHRDDPAPGVEEIVEFVAGRSSSEVTERVRDHVTFEDEPRQMVRDLKALQRGEEGGELSDQEVEDDWQTLLARVEAEPSAIDAEPRPVRNTEPRELEAPRRPRASRRRWRQTVSDVLAASFLLTTIGLGYQLSTKDEGLLGFSEVITLDTRDDRTRRDQPADESWQLVEVDGPTFAFSLRFETIELEHFSNLEIRFFAETGSPVKSVRMATSRNPRDPPKILVSRDWLSSGRYRIALLGLDEHQRDLVPIDEYRIELSYAGEQPD